METLAMASPIHGIVKEAINIGAGLYRLYKAYQSAMQSGADGRQHQHRQPQPQLQQQEQSVSGQKVEHLRGNVAAVEQEIQRVLDHQASLVAVVSEGAAQVCARLDALQSTVSKGFDCVVRTVKDESAIRDAREFKMKLGMAEKACNRVLEDMAVVAESRQRQFPACALRDMEKAESAAIELYIWANSFVPSSPDAMTKKDKLQMMPYIVAMAYAVRIQVITQLLERDMVEQESDKITYLKRARKIVEDFMAVMAAVLEGIMADTSLLEIAFDYRLPIAMYLALMTSSSTSVNELLVPDVKSEGIAVWDDGLSSIRDVLQIRASGADDQDNGYIIELSTVSESVWWATFTGKSLDAVHASDLATSVDVRDLCHVLGAGQDECPTNFALKPGQKSALTKLPTPSALRATLCARITEAREAAQGVRPPPPPDSFARTNAPPPVDALRSAGAATASLEVGKPRTIDNHINHMTSVALCAGANRAVVGCGDNSLKVLNLRDGQHTHTLSGHSGQITCVAVSADGKRAVSGSCDKSVRVWRAGNGSCQRTLQGHTTQVKAVAVSPEGSTIAYGSEDSTIRLWNIFTAQIMSTTPSGSGAISCLIFSPDGKRLVWSGNNSLIKVWNLRTCAIEHTLRGHSGVVHSVVVMPDSRRLISGGADRTIRVWSLSSGAEEMTLAEHSGAVKCMAAFPDGKRIASGGDDRNVRVWNLRTRALERTLAGHNASVRCVAVSPDGRSLLSASDDRTIKEWPVSGGGGGGGVVA